MTRADLFFPAISQAGLHPDRVVWCESDKEEEVLSAMEEGLSFGGLSAVDDEGKLQDHHASLAKAFCTLKGRETVAWGREILGGNGIVADCNVARFFADIEALYSYEGTYQMQNLIVGRAITGLSAFV
jgi:alkylation response protein AidB-like acyl-CoA dehydrogenase